MTGQAHPGFTTFPQDLQEDAQMATLLKVAIGITKDARIRVDPNMIKSVLLLSLNLSSEEEIPYPCEVLLDTLYNLLVQRLQKPEISPGELKLVVAEINSLPQAQYIFDKYV